jgi:cellulose synthase/poly-beta-1,6-N-acetylglucosamine synthase-like glycosyltransferase
MLAALSLVFATLPLAMTLGNLGAYRTPRRASGRPVLSVLVPARNEARNIAETVRCILASEDVELELIVLD